MKKNWYLLSAVFLYLATRLINLVKFPIFADEAIYIRWSQIMWHDATQRFMPLADGKPPLHMWLLIPFLKVFSDPLLAGRLFSVFSGLFSLIGIWFLIKELFNRKSAYLAVFLYVFLPFSLIYDRMALTDSFLLAIMIWFLYFLVKLLKKPALDVAMVTGILLGMAFLTKPTGLFFLMFLPCSLVLYSGKKKKEAKRFLIYFLVVVLFGGAMYMILMLSPLFGSILRRSKEYTFSIEEFMGAPFYTLNLTLGKIIPWSFRYFTFFVMGMFFVGNIYAVLKKNRQMIFLILIFYLFFVVNAVFGRVIYSRYFLVFLPSVIGLSCFMFWEMVEKYGKRVLYLLLILFFVPCFWFDFFLIFKPLETPFAPFDREQYLTSWSCGVGIREIAYYFKNQEGKDKIYVVTEGFFGTLPDGLAIYLNNYGIGVEGVGVPIAGISEEMFKKIDEGYKAYMVVNNTRKKFDDPRTEVVLEFAKPEGEDGSVEKLMLLKINK